jgi:hypothetical protein
MALEAFDGAVESLAAADVESLSVRERLESLDRLETVARILRSRSCAIAGSLERRGDSALGGACAKVIADVVRISPTEARRRIRDAGQLAPRTTQVLPADLPATAAAWKDGLLDVEHLRVIQRFLRDLPEDLHPAVVEKAEAFLARKPASCGPTNSRRSPTAWHSRSIPTESSPTSTGHCSAASSGVDGSGPTG